MDDREPEGIVISSDELQDAKIDERLEMQRASMAGVIQPSGPEKTPVRRLIFTNWFYLMLAGALGAFVAWAALEPLIIDGAVFTGKIDSIDSTATPSLSISTPAGVTLQGKITVAGDTMWRVIVDNKSGSGVAGTRVLKRGFPPEHFAFEDLKPGDIVTVRIHEERLSEFGFMDIASVIRVESPGTATVADANSREFWQARHRTDTLVKFLLFPAVAGLVALLIGAVEGIICRTFARAAWCGGIGMLIGLVAGFICNFPANIVYNAVGQLSDALNLHAGAEFLLQMFSRALAWTLVGMGMGLGQGIALKSRKLVLNGFIGGMIGGLVGGLLFDPIAMLLDQTDPILAGSVSRGVAITILGGMVGALIGLTDLLTRDAWLKVIAGPLRGKEFSFNRTPIRLGSSPKSDIYLFKDAAIDPTHAVINKLRDTYEIADENSSTGVFINGQRIAKAYRLNDGDLVQIGESQFKYSTKESKRA